MRHSPDQRVILTPPPHPLGLNMKYEHKEKRFVSGEKVELKKVDVVSLSSSEVIGKSRENLMVPLKDD